jgi:hypothetical protein
VVSVHCWGLGFIWVAYLGIIWVAVQFLPTVCFIDSIQICKGGQGFR